MARFLLLVLVASLVIERTFGEAANLSRIDQLLDSRYKPPREQREWNFDANNYPQDMRRREVDLDYESRVAKNRRHDDDDDDDDVYRQMRASRPPPIAYGSKTSAAPQSSDGKRLVPIPQPIPVLLPLIVSQPYPVPVFPLNLSAMLRNRPHDKLHNHQHVYPDHGHEHQSDAPHSPHEHPSNYAAHAHGHQYQSDAGHAHGHQFEGHAH